MGVIIQWPASVASAVESLRTHISTCHAVLVENTPGDPQGLQLGVDSERENLLLRELTSMMEVLDGFEKTYPLVQSTKRAQA